MVELGLVVVVDEVVLIVVVVVVAVVVNLLVDTLELDDFNVVAEVDVDELLPELPAATDKTKRPSITVFHSITPPPRCLQC